MDFIIIILKKNAFSSVHQKFNYFRKSNPWNKWPYLIQISIMPIVIPTHIFNSFITIQTHTWMKYRRKNISEGKIKYLYFIQTRNCILYLPSFAFKFIYMVAMMILFYFHSIYTLYKQEIHNSHICRKINQSNLVWHVATKQTKVVSWASIFCVVWRFI